jgi:hypothetical protein
MSDASAGKVILPVKCLNRLVLLPLLSGKLLHAENAQVGEVFIAMDTLEVLIALDGPASAAAIRATQVVTILGIVRVEETVCILFLWEFASTFDRLHVEDKIFELP